MRSSDWSADVCASDLPVPGHSHSNVLSAVELLASPQRDLGKTAVVFDDVGHYEAIAATEYLISKGLDVTFLTRFAVVAPQLDFVTRVDPAFRRFAASGRLPFLTPTPIEDIRQVQ